MRARVIAVGTRLPAWARSACAEYLKRMTGTLPVSLLEIDAAPRTGNTSAARAMAAEGERILRALGRGDYLVALDERGKPFSTRELSGWLAERMRQGSDLAFVIGGADGLSGEVLERAGLKLALSRLTLPHALARVLLCEQLYRAHGILANHPYHRD